jgi:hypothetical protein
MDIKEAIKSRHAVRAFKDEPIKEETVKAIKDEIDVCNKTSGLHIQLITNEKEAFSGMMAHYGSFRNCANYIAMVGKPGSDELVGYYGEKIVLLCQQLGLNSCWVAMSYSKGKVPAVINAGEKLHIVIALGYGQTQGVAHKSKPMEKLCHVEGTMPAWFKNGMDMAMLAPTAVNQQKFCFTLKEENKVHADTSFGFYAKIDLGIAKFHFEIGAGKENFDFA